MTISKPEQGYTQEICTAPRTRTETHSVKSGGCYINTRAAYLYTYVVHLLYENLFVDLIDYCLYTLCSLLILSDNLYSTTYILYLLLALLQ